MGGCLRRDLHKDKDPLTDETFRKIYADADLRGAIKKKARRLAATREAAEDAEAEAWAVISQAPDRAHIQSLRDAAYFTVASSVRQDKNTGRAEKRWASIIIDFLGMNKFQRFIRDGIDKEGYL
jgi:hypothetical protein